MMTNLGNHITQGQFSFLPPLTDKQISAQIKYALKNNWAIGIEYTDDPHPRNTYWEMFGNPMFDLKDPAGILMEINNCRKTFPNHYIRVTAFNSTRESRVRLCRISSTDPRRNLALVCFAKKQMDVTSAIPFTPTQQINLKTNVINLHAPLVD